MSAKRKKDHLELCLTQPVETGTTGLENYSFVHNALPEMDFKEIDLSTNFLGKKLKAPILISSMTGGTKEACKINKNLAVAAQKLGVAMAVGSQRTAIENPRLANTFQIRKFAPDIVLLANLGAVQLNYGFGIKECQKCVEMIDADGLILHLNPLQEAIQPEGNVNFSGLLAKIKKIAAVSTVPLIVKEVGAGISKKTAEKLLKAGIKIIDVAGWGGTNWALIESLRRSDQPANQIFSYLGIPTSEAIKDCGSIDGLTVIGSGGIRNGVEIAKALALGADLVGLALPLLKPATVSSIAEERELQKLIFQLKVTMFCVGAKKINELTEKNLRQK